jgi:Leucine-rich repeat (LRR) protein
MLTAGEIVKLAPHEFLQVLLLKDNAIATLSEEFEQPGLTTLDLSGNQLETLAPLAKLKSLETLVLSNNKLTSMAGIGELAALQKLVLVRWSGIMHYHYRIVASQ